MSEKRFNWLVAWFGLVVFIALVFIPLIARCEENELNMKPMAIGCGLILAPILTADKNLSWGHGMELEGWSCASSYIISEIFPTAWPLGPSITATIDVVYRWSENLALDLTRRKLAMDLVGCLGFTLVKISINKNTTVYHDGEKLNVAVQF